MAVEGNVNSYTMGVAPASLAERLDEIMRKREASRMTPSLGCHCQRINVQEGTKIKSSVLLLILRCWTTKWRCQVGRGIEGAHRKGQVLVVNIRVISNI